MPADFVGHPVGSSSHEIFVSFDGRKNGVPPSKVDAGVKSRIACQVRGEQVGAVSVPGFCVPRTAPATVPTQLFPTTDVRWDIRDGRE